MHYNNKLRLWALKMVDIKTLIDSPPRKYRSMLIFGPPGAGKGTLGKFLLGKFLSSAGNHFHLSSGDIFRGLSPESPAGKIYHSYAGKGHLVPDDVTMGIWHHYVEGLIATNRYFPHQQLLLLDGLPRTVAQVEMLEKYTETLHLIVLETPNTEALIKRMKRRSLIEGRHDDMDDSILQTRMGVYEKTTQAILKHYPSSLISRFDADQRPLEVLRDVLSKLSHLLSHPESS
jgi:adenylate kinase